MNKLLILLGLMLVTATIPITNVSAAEFDYTVTLINDIDIYNIYSHPEKIENKYVYNDQALVTFHMPLLVETTDKTIDFNKGQLNKLISHTVQGNTKNKQLTFEYFMLINETYEYELGVYQTINIPYNYTWHDNETGLNYTEVRYYEQREMIDTIWVEDYRYVWYNLDDLEEYDAKNEGFICIDIVGHTTASIDPWSADIIPTLEINNVKRSYPEFAWWNMNWRRSKKIVIDHTKVACHLNDFTVLMVNKSADFANARADGYDFRFVAADNATVYHQSLEYFNVSNWELTSWVNITSLSNLVDTTVWLYYDNPAANANPSSKDAFDDDYVLYVHFNETDAVQHDYTENGHDSTNIDVQNQATHTQKVADGCNQYEGDVVNDKVTFGAISDYNIFTIEIWAYPTWFNAFQRIVSEEYEFLLDCKADGTVRMYMGTGAGWGAGATSGAGNAQINVWQQFVGTSDGTNIDVWLDGVWLATAVNGNNLDTATAYVGGDQWETYGFIDVWTVSSVERSECWMDTRYANIIDAPDFAFFSDEIAAPPLPGPASYTNITGMTPFNESCCVCPCSNAICFEASNTIGARMNVTVFGRETDYNYFNIWAEFDNITNGTYCFCIEGITPTIVPHALGHSHTHRSVPTAGQWYNITFDGGESQHMEVDLRNATIPFFGHYTASYWVSIQDSDVTPQGHVFAIRVICNGVEVEGSYREYTFEKKDVGANLQGEIHAEFLPGDNLSFQYIASDTDIRITGNGTYSTDNISFYAIIERMDESEHHPMKYNHTYYWYVNSSNYGGVASNESAIFWFTTAQNVSDCNATSNATGGGFTSNEAWLVGIVIVFSIFGIVAFVKTRRFKL